jgi:hypothetical protein
MIKLTYNLDYCEIINRNYLLFRYIIILVILILKETFDVILLFKKHPIECHIVVIEELLFHKFAVLVHWKPYNIKPSISITRNLLVVAGILNQIQPVLQICSNLIWK